MKRLGDFLGGFQNKTDSYSFNELERVSDYMKRSKNWEWLEDWISYYDINYDYDHKLHKKLKLNYRLFNGRGVSSTYNITDIDSSILAEEGYTSYDEEIEHLDILTPIVKSLIGQSQMMPLKPMAIDSSVQNINARKKKRLELRKQWLNNTIIQPLKDQAFQEFMMENDISDPYSLSPDQQKEMQQQVGERQKALTPKEIERFMGEEYRSPSETMIQQILDFVLERDMIKFWTDENFKHFCVTGSQYYDLDVRNKKANMRILNPLNFRHSNTDSVIFTDNEDWGLYEEEVSIAEIFAFHGNVITNADIKKLDDLYSNYYQNRHEGLEQMPEPMATRVATIDAQTGFLDMAPKINTHEGQAFMRALNDRYGKNSLVGDRKIRRLKAAVKQLRKLKNVKRYNAKQDTFEEFWTSDNYEKNPKLDIEIRERYFPHVYTAYMYGEGGSSNKLFLEKGPCKNQYKSMNNPWDTRLPFMGVEYSKVFNNTENVAIFDLGKPWQDKFNLRVNKYTEKFNTDIGRVFTLATTLKPKDITIEQWLRSIKINKAILLDTSNADVNGIDAQIVKQIDLSSADQIAGVINELEWIRNQAAIAMSYNPSRLGQIVPQMQVTNNQQNIQQSSYQTQDIFTLHNVIIERVLNAHINNEKFALKDNDYIASYILDDMSRAELSINKDMIDEAEIGISIKNNSEHFNTISKLREDARVMMSSGSITYSELIRMQLANNFADLLNLAERADEKKQKELQAEREHQLQLAQEQNQAMKQVENMRQEFVALQNELDRTLKLKGYELESDKFRKTMDADLNGQIDALQVKQLETQSTEKENAKDRQLEKELKEQELKNKIEIERIKARNKPASK